MRSLSVWTAVVLVFFSWTGSVDGGLFNPGDLAFIGFNVDGNDDFAIVLLANSDPGTLVRLTDKEWQGTAFNTGEGAVTWTLPQALPAGTVVTFSNVDNASNSGFGPSSGTLSGALQLAVGGETLYAFLGPNATTPTTFLAAISTTAGDYNGSTGKLTGTGLSQGTTAVLLPSSARGSEYSGSRTNQSNLSGYLPLIGNTALNWTTSATNGTAVLPFDTQSFSTPAATPSATPEPATWSLGVLAALGVAAAMRRRHGSLENKKHPAYQLAVRNENC